MGRWAAVALAASLVVGGAAALGQGHGGGGGGGAIVFVGRRPPREVPRNFNPRAWASGSHVTSYTEDVSSHTWHISLMAFMPHPPNTREVTLAWFHIEPNNVRRYITNEPIALNDPGERILFHTTSVHRGVGEFEPMERYEAVITANDSRGARPLARGVVQLIGQVERHSGVVDFTRDNPEAH
jgi:hypothetical protein